MATETGYMMQYNEFLCFDPRCKYYLIGTENKLHKKLQILMSYREFPCIQMFSYDINHDNTD